MAREKYFSAQSVARILCAISPQRYSEAMVLKEKLCPEEPITTLGIYLDIALVLIDLIPPGVWGRWGRIVKLLVTAILSILVVMDLLGYRTMTSKIASDERTLKTLDTVPEGVELLQHVRSLKA